MRSVLQLVLGQAHKESCLRPRIAGVLQSSREAISRTSIFAPSVRSTDGTKIEAA
jgi:hypothetical protein